MNFIGLDLSLSSTGVVVYQAHVGHVPLAITVETEPVKTAKEELERLRHIEDSIMENVNRFWVRGHTLVAIEAPAYSKNVGHAAARHGLQYLVRDRLYSAGIPFLVVGPSSLKKWVIKGNAKKEEMKLATYKRWGFEAEGNDMIDSYCLCRLAEAWTLKDKTLVKGVELVSVEKWPE